MTSYNHQRIEKKWQKAWEKAGIFLAKNKSKKPKFYCLVEFPYPSGQGLHVGHTRVYTALDIIARKKRAEGYNVLFPMGWDAFGLPTENYAIKTGIHPAVLTKRNTEKFKRQMKKLGFSFDWTREINTTDPNYYKWTQWIFLQLFKKGLAYKAKMPINWCPSCKIGLANEEVINGRCERCGTEVTRKEKEQWMLRITKYADRLIEDLNKVDYPEKVKISQREWIGKSEGAEIIFQLLGAKGKISVFTTRPDTLFGCTYLVLSPEHPLIPKIKNKISNFEIVENYIKKAKSKTERERLAQAREKTGVEIKGIKALNPVNNREIPIFVADYVLPYYGTGAIMAVPAHDERDFEFARKYNLPVIKVITPDLEKENREKEKITMSNGRYDSAYEGEGFLINSGRFTGMPSKTAREKIVKWLEEKGIAKKAVYYKLRDWVFSRQRYWGEPIPMIKCEKCGWVPVPEKDLPVVLPKVKDFKPSEKGESPLAKAKKWVKVKCPKCGGLAERETDVMPNWAGSNWYYLRYCDPKNDKKLADPKLLKYWMPVDWYNGGMEHTTLHLLYSRFIYKFLWDIKAVPTSIGPEPYKKRTSHGMVLGKGGIKMSKSKGNVVNPDDVVKEYGADTMRVYEMFMGPFSQAVAWDMKGLKGARRFLEKVWALQEKVSKKTKKREDLERMFAKTIKKVSEDIEKMKFNTAISALMILANELEKLEEIPKNYFSLFLKILNPFAPHITEELWSRCGFSGFCSQQKWPKYKEELAISKEITLVIQVNGKVRDTINVSADISEEQAKEKALKSEKIKKWLNGKEIKKVIFVKGRLINFVV